MGKSWKKVICLCFSPPIIAIILGIVTELRAQEWVHLDSVVYYDSSAHMTNPYADSILARQLALFDSSNFSIIDPVRILPDVRAIDENGDTLKLMQFIRTRQYIPKSLTVLLEIQVDWKGKIRKGNIMRYRGHGIEKVPFRKFIQSLLVGVSHIYGYPTENKFIIPLSRR